MGAAQPKAYFGVREALTAVGHREYNTCVVNNRLALLATHAGLL